MDWVQPSSFLSPDVISIQSPFQRMQRLVVAKYKRVDGDERREDDGIVETGRDWERLKFVLRGRKVRVG